jgi:hypothetical protein
VRGELVQSLAPIVRPASKLGGGNRAKLPRFCRFENLIRGYWHALCSPQGAMLGHLSALLRRIVLQMRRTWLALLAGNMPREPPEPMFLFCASCGADTLHSVFADSGFGWYSQVRRCRRCGRESLEVCAINPH